MADLQPESIDEALEYDDHSPTNVAVVTQDASETIPGHADEHGSPAAAEIAEETGANEHGKAAPIHSEKAKAKYAESSNRPVQAMILASPLRGGMP